MLRGWWHYVFGGNDLQPDPAGLLEDLQRLGLEISGKFRGDDLGWFSAEIAYAPDLPPLVIERYLAKEDDIRTDLNRWAAWLETFEANPHTGRLMQRVIN